MDYTILKIFIKKSIKEIGRLTLFACLMFTVSNSFAAQQVIIVSSTNNSHHKLMVKSIQKHLKTTNINVKTFDLGQEVNISNNNDLIVSLNHKIAENIDEKKLPNPKLRVFTHTSQNIDPTEHGEAHLSMTQPVCQQFALARLLNPEWKVISVLLSTKHPVLMQILKSCAKQYKHVLNAIIVDKHINIIDALNTSLSNVDVLIALPDPVIYNAKTIKSILLTTYRHRIPVIGFSENFVRAGALAAIHSSPDQLGKQISELIQQHYNKVNVNKHLYTEYFSVITNKNVARSLGINIPDQKILTEKLRRKYNE